MDEIEEIKSIMARIDKNDDSDDMWMAIVDLDGSYKMFIKTLLKRIGELESDLKLNASMIAKQTDRVKELEEGIRRHRIRPNAQSGKGGFIHIGFQTDEELYSLLPKEEK